MKKDDNNNNKENKKIKEITINIFKYEFLLPYQ